MNRQHRNECAQKLFTQVTVCHTSGCQTYDFYVAVYVSNDVIVRLDQCMQQVRDCCAIVHRRLELHALRRLWSFRCIISSSPAWLAHFTNPLWRPAMSIEDGFDIEFLVRRDCVTTQLLHIVIKLRSLFSVMARSHACDVSVTNNQPVGCGINRRQQSL